MTINFSDAKVIAEGGENMYPKLRGRIVEKYDTLRNFAKELNVTEATLSLKLNGKSALKYDDIERFSELLDIPKEEYGAYFFTKKL